MISRSFKLKKKLILAALAAVLLADVLLAAASYRFSTDSQSAQKAALAEARAKKKVLESAVQRAIGIRSSLPEVQRQCELFEESLRPSSRGYSGILADIGQIAGKAGLTTESVAFHQDDLPARGMVKVDVTATIAGDYNSVVRFINGLQRSDNFYVLDGLSLAGGGTDSRAPNLKLNLHLKTYFRA